MLIELKQMKNKFTLPITAVPLHGQKHPWVVTVFLKLLFILQNGKLCSCDY